MDDHPRQSLLEAFLEHRPALTRFAASLLKNDVDADDLLQDLYLKLTRTNAGNVGNLRAYLYQAVHRLVIDRLRAVARRTAREKDWSGPVLVAADGDAVDEAPNAERHLAAKQKMVAVCQAIDQLPPRCREVFVRQRVQGQSQTEIADALGISRKAVEKQMTRALKHLAEHLAGSD